MNCEEFELMMADALGGELSAADRPAFDAHLAGCERCRKDYDTSRRTLDDMRTLPGTRKVRARREGNRLVIEDATTVESPAASAAAPAAVTTAPRASAMSVGHGPSRSRTARFMASPLRYAAGLLIAFTAGYVMHAGLTLADAARFAPTVAKAPPEPAPSFEGSVLRAYARNTGRSDLAKCLIAMSTRGG